MITKVLTRREFLRLAMLASSGLVLASCAPAATPTSAPTSAPVAAPTSAPVAVPTLAPTAAPTARPTAVPTPAAAQPQYGGVLTANMNSDPPNFDPLSNTTSWVINVVAPCYNGLVMFDPFDPKKIIGDLAESWEFSADSKTLTFKLLKGVKFHDGKPFTSADVKFTFDHMRNPPQGAVVVRKASLESIDRIEALDDYTVRFILKRPQPSILTVLATGWMLVLPKHILQEKGDMKKDIIGTGPYKFKEYIRGVSLELVKNPEYHIKGRPYLDGIKLFVTPDPATTMGYFRTGQIMMWDEMTGDDGRRAQKEFGDKVVIQNGLGINSAGITFNARRKPWDDVRVRQAASLAIDRVAGLKVILQDDGIVGGLVPPGIWAGSESEIAKLPGYGKDYNANLAAAKKLLADAGFPNGFSATMLVRRNATHETRAVFVKDQLAKAGINVTLNVQETAAYTDLVNKRNFELVSQGFDVLVNDPDFMFGGFYTNSPDDNLSGVFDKEMDALFAKQQQTPDVEARKKIVNQMEKIAIEGSAQALLHWKTKFIGHSKRVHNLVINPEPDNNHRLQDIWLSKE